MCQVDWIDLTLHKCRDLSIMLKIERKWGYITHPEQTTVGDH